MPAKKHKRERFIFLSHFSVKPLRLNRRTKYYEHPDNPFGKPGGFWLSDESQEGWSDWCKTSKFQLKSLKHEAIFKCDTKEWLVIESKSAMRIFEKEFLVKGSVHSPKFFNLDMEKLKKKYKGILISPYRFDHHHKSFWYYSWDCASACVWDLTTISRVNKRSKKNGRKKA